MNGETHELESAHKVTIAHDDAGRATITVQGGGSVAIAHLTPAEGAHVSASLFEMVAHLDPAAFEESVSHADEAERFRKALDNEAHEAEELRKALADAGAKLQEAVAELEAAKGEASGGGDVTLGVA